MYRAIPAANKILAKKWQQENDARHIENLKNIKGTVNCGAPVKLDHLKKKSKKTQIMEGMHHFSFIIQTKKNRLQPISLSLLEPHISLVANQGKVQLQ